MKFFLLPLAILVSINSYAQIITSNDTAVCGSYEDTLQALSSTQSSMFSDDMHDVLLDIGFTFNFYGISYTQLVVSGNGYITFDAAQASQYSPWVIAAPIPNPGNLPENAIMAPWQDIDVGQGGSIYFGMTGSAPNRMFIVTWCEVPMFSCSSDLHTSQVVLYEGSDVIEMFLQEKPLCAGWNSGNGIHGLVDATSTNFDIVIDPISGTARNAGLQWTANNEGWLFIPNNPATSYTINSIAYVPIIAGQNTWSDESSNILGVGPSLPINISTTTTYFANVTGLCASGVLSDSIKIIVTGCFDIDLTSVSASCLGDDAFIVCTPDTILPLWDAELLDMSGNSLFLVSNIVTISYTFVDLFPGTYVVNASAGISNSQDTIIVGQIQNPVSVNSDYTSVNCYNGYDGEIAVSASGGLLPYTYYIDGILNTNAYPLDSVFYDLSAGTYIISVVDDNDCMFRDTILVATPSHTLQALASSKVIVCNGSSDGFCVGSSSGGTPSYSYEWFDSGMNSFSTNDTAFGLIAGSYYLEVMDANGCDTFTTVHVIEPQTPLESSPELFNVSCTGDTTGMIVGDASGSWAPYTYYWLDMQGDTLQESGMDILTRDTLFNLLAGSYQLHIEDFQGCRAEYVFNVAEPEYALSIDSMKVISDISCYGDSVGIARLYVSGGDPSYFYLWDNGETDIIANTLTSGYHSVLLTDDWGCEVLDSIYISENTLIESDLSTVQDISCYGDANGIASISSVGGASSIYTYFWSQGQQTVDVNIDIAYSLLQGSYYVTTRDTLGCEVLDSIYISQPEPLSMEAAELDWIDCFGYNNGEGFALATGGTSPYSFSWDNGQWIGDTVGTLTPGLHVVVVTDARGCTATDTIFTHEPDSLYINILENQAVLPYCGQLNINTASLPSLAGGGTGSYTYEWNDNPVQPQTTSTAISLTSLNYFNIIDNSYIVTVTDEKGCIASDSTSYLQTYTITMEVSAISLVTYLGGNDISCYGEDDGQALVLPLGAHAPYSYQWFGPNSYVSINDTISNLLAGIYSVLVSDTNGCTALDTIVITEPAQIFFTTLGVTDNESCLGACDGEVQVSVMGGVSPYSAIATETTSGDVITSAMASDSIVTAICSGTYTFTFSDENGCSSILDNGGVNQQTISAYDTTFAEINISSIASILCNGSAAGVLEVLDPNTNTGYTYSWQDINGNTVTGTTTASNLLAGTYVLYADYNNTLGCTSTDTAIVTELSAVNAPAVVTHVACFGYNTGMATVNPSGGTPGYTFLWNPGGSTGANIANLLAGSYTLSVTDANNCQQVDSFVVDQPQVLVATINQNGYVLTADVPTGGVAPYSYLWMEQSSLLNPSPTGLNYVVDTYGAYYVVITDANGCESISNIITYDQGPSGTIGLSNALNLSVYPNPFTEETTVDFGQKINKAVIRVVDVYGKQIEMYELKDTDKHIIKRTNKASGVYFVEIEIKGLKMFNKIILK